MSNATLISHNINRKSGGTFVQYFYCDKDRVGAGDNVEVSGGYPLPSSKVPFTLVDTDGKLKGTNSPWTLTAISSTEWKISNAESVFSDSTGSSEDTETFTANGVTSGDTIEDPRRGARRRAIDRRAAAAARRRDRQKLLGRHPSRAS